MFGASRAAEFAQEVREGENVSAVAREMSQTLTDQDLQATEVSH